MPGKSTDINIRCLFFEPIPNNVSSRVVASLDAEKAVDLVEWAYFWVWSYISALGPVAL